ncbi:condensation domain-containing protein [Tsukamurella soli]|uniref:Condensation domain-containing protein n=1 Tax=Tsukamurella soli TaxID=644556 RepID=A0ABP8J410_9ACTN
MLTGYAEKWRCEPGEWMAWTASEATRAAMMRAEPCGIVPSYVQQDHLRSSRVDGRPVARLGVTKFTVFERFDEAVMHRVFTDFLRAHTSFHTWFDRGADGDWIGRTLPADRLELTVAARGGSGDDIPGDGGHGTLKDFVFTHTRTPAEWSSFTFGVGDLQHATGADPWFTIALASDHLYTDGVSQAITFIELLSRYSAAIAGVPYVEIPGRPYAAYAAEQRRRVGRLRCSDEVVQRWRAAIVRSGGTTPSFPLSLGLAPGESAPGFMAADTEFIGPDVAERFACVVRSAGGGMNAGLLAVMAELHRRFTGSETFAMTLPRNDRPDPLDRFAVGWYVTLVPVHFECPAGTAFADVVRVAQDALVEARELDGVPIYPMIDLLRDDPAFGVEHGFAAPMLSYLDLTRLPGGELAAKHDFSVFGNSSPAREVFFWLNRHDGGLDYNAMHPDTPEAHAAIARYVEEFRAVVTSLAETGGAEPGGLAAAGALAAVGRGRRSAGRAPAA